MVTRIKAGIVCIVRPEERRGERERDLDLSTPVGTLQTWQTPAPTGGCLYTEYTHKKYQRANRGGKRETESVSAQAGLCSQGARGACPQLHMYGVRSTVVNYLQTALPASAWLR